MRLSVVLCLLAVFLWACEDGPQQIFEPFEGDATLQNGHVAAKPWVQEGSKEFDVNDTADDHVGRARFCDEATASELIQWMVTQPIYPDKSVGGIALWTPEGKRIHVDSLLGQPAPRQDDGSWEPGYFCDPWGVYSNALTWGPTNEIIVFFEKDTRLITDIQVGGQYLGSLKGNASREGQPTRVQLTPFQRLRVGNKELENYPTWAQSEMVSLMHSMIRETFFAADPLPEGFDCIEAKLCDVIYQTPNHAVPQKTYVVFHDSGITIGFSDDGYLLFVVSEQVRIADFEMAASIGFGDEQTVAPTFQSKNALKAACTLNLNSEMTWAKFKELCVNEQTLSRANYEVHTQRDAATVDFNAVSLGFLGRPSERGLLADGAQPDDTDVLYAISFSRSLNAPVLEYVPSELARVYKEKLERRFKMLLPTEAEESHWLKQLHIDVPATLLTAAQRIGELRDDKGSWLPRVVAEIQQQYEKQTQHALGDKVDERIADEIFLLEPFVDAVMSVLSHGKSDAIDAVKFFRTTDNRRWVIGRAHFMQDGQPYRMSVQYSLNFGAVTYVSVERGFSEMDDVFQQMKNYLVQDHQLQPTPYYQLSMSQLSDNPLGLGGKGLATSGFDRQLETMSVTLTDPTTLTGATEPKTLALTLAGKSIEDEAGYNRQIKGERWEFIPANKLYLYGKETQMTVYVEQDGAIGKVIQPRFKGTMQLCQGLHIKYGDNVVEKIVSWQKQVSLQDYHDCEIVFNYSENGNLLDAVVSLRNKVGLSTTDKRAVTASIWR